MRITRNEKRFIHRPSYENVTPLRWRKSLLQGISPRCRKKEFAYFILSIDSGALMASLHYPSTNHYLQFVHLSIAHVKMSSANFHGHRTSDSSGATTFGMDILPGHQISVSKEPEAPRVLLLPLVLMNSKS